MAYTSIFLLLCSGIALRVRSNAFVVVAPRISKFCVSISNCAALHSATTAAAADDILGYRSSNKHYYSCKFPRPRRKKRCLRMDDEIARKGIKEELTTRDEYLATRFTKLSASGHDLTPFTPSEAQEAAVFLSPEQKAMLFGGTAKKGSAGANKTFRDHREKGLYACVVGGLPLFTSGWKLEPKLEDDCPSFAEPCDGEHVLEEYDENKGVTSVFCARSRVFVGTVFADSGSPSGKRFLITGAALEFHPLEKPLPVRCQPENYWGSEGQYRAWVLE